MDYVKLPKTKRGEITFKKLCTAAEELFSENGFYDTEISDITKRAGVAAGTFYIYFSDKHGAFLHLLDELGRELRHEIRRAKEAQNLDSFIELERISVRTFFCFINKHFGLFRIVWQAQFVDVDSFKQYYERFSGGYIREIMKSQSTGEIQAFDPALISFVLMGIHSFVALKHFVFDGSALDEAVVEQVVEFIAHGLLRNTD